MDSYFSKAMVVVMLTYLCVRYAQGAPVNNRRHVRAVDCNNINTDLVCYIIKHFDKLRTDTKNKMTLLDVNLSKNHPNPNTIFNPQQPSLEALKDVTCMGRALGLFSGDTRYTGDAFSRLFQTHVLRQNAQDLRDPIRNSFLDLYSKMIMLAEGMGLAKSPPSLTFAASDNCQSWKDASHVLAQSYAALGAAHSFMVTFPGSTTSSTTKFVAHEESRGHEKPISTTHPVLWVVLGMGSMLAVMNGVVVVLAAANYFWGQTRADDLRDETPGRLEAEATEDPQHVVVELGSAAQSQKEFRAQVESAVDLTKART